MHYLVYSFGALCLWGVWAFLPRLASPRIDFLSASVWEWLGMVAIVLPCAVLLGGRPVTGGASCWWLVLTGACALGGSALYYQALLVAGPHVPTVMVISAMYPLVSVLLTVVVLKQTIHPVQALGMVLCVAGAALLMTFKPE